MSTNRVAIEPIRAILCAQKVMVLGYILGRFRALGRPKKSPKIAPESFPRQWEKSSKILFPKAPRRVIVTSSQKTNVVRAVPSFLFSLYLRRGRPPTFHFPSGWSGPKSLDGHETGPQGTDLDENFGILYCFSRRFRKSQSRGRFRPSRGRKSNIFIFSFF